MVLFINLDEMGNFGEITDEMAYFGLPTFEESTSTNGLCTEIETTEYLSTPKVAVLNVARVVHVSQITGSILTEVTLARFEIVIDSIKAARKLGIG